MVGESKHMQKRAIGDVKYNSMRAVLAKVFGDATQFSLIIGFGFCCSDPGGLRIRYRYRILSSI